MTPFLQTLLLLLLPLAIGLNVNNEANCLSLPPYICALRPITSYTARGIVIFTPHFSPTTVRKCFVRIQAHVTNLPPGEHGFHVHTYGDVTAADGTSAGGHFSDLRGKPLAHGYPDSKIRHWGDFGNLTADADGVAEYDRVDSVIRYRSLLGRSVVVHRDNDKGPVAQPSGGAGPRIGICVIGFANPASVGVPMEAEEPY